MGSDLFFLLLLLLVVVLVWRGPKTLPELGKTLGEAVRGARNAARGTGHEEDEGRGDGPPPAAG
jgi:Sec-independent protein translocase protein TatA